MVTAIITIPNNSFSVLMSVDIVILASFLFGLLSRKNLIKKLNTKQLKKGDHNFQFVTVSVSVVDQNVICLYICIDVCTHTL